MTRAWLGLGGNIGDVPAALRTALEGLSATPGISVTSVSALYRTPPWGPVDQPWFHNCCAEVFTELEPRALLQACQAVEREGHRTREIRWGPRTIDVDIIAYEGFESRDTALEVPHPRAHQRAFVMVPLAELAPDLTIAGQEVSRWAQALADPDMELLEESAAWWKGRER